MNSDDEDGGKRMSPVKRGRSRADSNMLNMNDDTTKNMGASAGGLTSPTGGGGGGGDGDMDSQIYAIVDKIVAEKADSLDYKFRYWHDEVNKSIDFKFS
jgi:hypothetical protein